MHDTVKMLMDFLSTMVELVFFQLLLISIFGIIAVELSPGKLGDRCVLDENVSTIVPAVLGPVVPGAAADVCVKWNALYKSFIVGYENKSLGAIIFNYFNFIFISNLLVIQEQGLTNIMMIVMNVFFFFIVVISFSKKMSKKKKKRLYRFFSDTR